MLDAPQSSVDGRKRSSSRCCAVERCLSLHVIWIGLCFPTSIGFRLQERDIASVYDVSRATSLMQTLRLLLLICVPLMRHLHWLLLLQRRFDEITLSHNCQIVARHFTEAKYLIESSSKDQENVSDLAACKMDLWWHGHAIAVQAFPAVWLFRGHLVEKNGIFPAFQTLFEQTSDASERFTIDAKRISTVRQRAKGPQHD